MFQFFVLPGSNVDNEKVVDIPSFVIRWPPILVTFGFILTVALMAIGGKSSLSPDQEQFKKILTFFVSLLNATTVLVVARIFKKPINGGGPAAPLGPGQ
jgi:hypothetical protein